MSEPYWRISSPFRSRNRTKAPLLLKVAAVTACFAFVFCWAIAGYIGWQLTHPQRRPIDTTPSAWGMKYENISFTSRIDNIPLQGWMVAAPENRRTVIIAHGYGRNRLQDDVPLFPIIQTLTDSGSNAVLFDFRNSGESGGTLTSVGQFEVRDLLGAIDFVRSHPEWNQQIILYGFSMGAATALVTGAQEPSVAAVIADSPFADLDSYLRDNLSVWSSLPAVPFNSMILLITPLLTGLDTTQMSPVSSIQSLGNRPVLLIHGEADGDIPIINSELLQKNYGNAQLLRIPEAVHVGSFRQNHDRYLTEVNRFLEGL